jgi:pimeloyl-ACP methyl ester carboxylesterase
MPLFGHAPFQRHFVARYFQRPPDPSTVRAFFQGYAECAAAPQLFRWFRPPLLRDLERRFAAAPERLRDVAVWWGERDRVVGPREQQWAEEALGVRWPARTFPGWGHYPMMDDPEGWVAALSAACHTTP